MPQANVGLYAFNRGLVSPLALARTDLGRVALSAERQTNWVPRSLGSMMLRPGFKHLGATKSNGVAEFLPFAFATDDTALVEVTVSSLRFWVDGALVSRAAVGTSVTNGTFASDLTGWTDNDDAGTTSAWAAGRLSLVGTGFAAAKRYQALSITAGDQDVEHALRVSIVRGPVTCRIGSTLGEDDYHAETVLQVGTHSLAFTPTGGTAYLEFESYTEYASLVDDVSIEAEGTLELPSPWNEDALSKIRIDQSGDVLFVAVDGYQQRRIERRSTTSWSIVKYNAIDGPLRLDNTSSISITPSALAGDITLTASAHLFGDHVDSVWSLTSAGQVTEATFSAEDQFSDPIRVVGVGAQRPFTIDIVDLTGTSTTITLQRSPGEPGSWGDVTSYTTDQSSVSHDDGFDNQIMYYRLGVKTGDFSSGTPDVTLTYTSGGITGHVRITSVTSALVAQAIVLKALGGTDAVRDWAEGSWSNFRGWPTSVKFFEGRLWWAGRGYYWGSVTDAYDSFDRDYEGDAGPIIRQAVAGPVDKIHWLLDLQRLIGGAEGAELSVRSSNENEPLTPDNFSIKDDSTQGSAAVEARKIDASGVFVQRSTTRVFELGYSFEPNAYTARDITIHVPHVGAPGVVRLAVQRQPDTRIHAVRSDGKVAVCLYNKAEDILAWVLVETDGLVEDVVVLPGAPEDHVYYVVKRTIDGVTKRYLERWATEDSCAIWSVRYEGDSTTSIDLADSETGLVYEDGTVLTVRDSDGAKVENVTVSGGLVTLSAAATYAHLTPAACYHADSHVYYSGVATATLTGLDHLEGETVVVWGDGKDQGTAVVSSGAITISESVEEAVIGLGYTAKFRSTKLAFADEAGTALSQVKRITKLGLIAAYTHRDGLDYGVRFGNLVGLPQIIDAATVESDMVHNVYDQRMISFPGEYDTDTRLCLQASAPRPATVLAAVIGMETKDDL